MAAWVAVCTPSAAQEPRGGPFSGLFNGSPKDQPHTLDLRGSAFTGWDDNPLASVPGVGGGDSIPNVDSRFVKPGIASGFQGSASYGFRRTGTRSQFYVAADGSVQQFGGGLDSGALRFYGYNAFTGLTTKVTNKTSISLGAGVAYAPYYQYAPFLKDTAAEESPVGTDYGFAIDAQPVRSTSASAGVENQFSKKSRISAVVAWDQRIVPGREITNVDTRTARATLHHNLTRKFGFHVGYGIQESRYEVSAESKPLRAHMMDVGVDYGDGVTLTFGRHYTLNLAIGASIAKNGDPRSVATTGKSTAFALTGNATLSRSLGRTWNTSIGYARATSYVVGFPEPIMTDMANAGIGGPIFSRLHFSAGAGASRGQQLFTERGGYLVAYMATTRLTYALATHLGLYSQASYYRFSIPPGFTTLGFVPNLERRSFSVGLSTWLPLIKQRRARRDFGDQTPTGQP